MISAILLAAGESKRLRMPKLLLPFGKSTILEQTIDNLLNSRVDEVIVVLGYRAEEMMRKLANRPVKIAINPNYHQGMSTSIVKGLSLVNNRAQAIMVALADQPLINSQTINRLIEESLGYDKGIVIPTYQAERGHPIIFASEYKEELLGLKGDIGGRQTIKEHPNDTLEVIADSKAITMDVNTINDYYTHLKLVNLK
jgi:molybdenum cofactor cytidylyltransferase